MTAYYNENDPFAAQWLRNLIDAGHIAPGIVDTRSIEEVTENDLKGFTQCHFFAGIGVWSYALRRAGWPDDRPVWTGSCPCQPFSASGSRKGFDDKRHLWPVWFRLIAQRRPCVIFGEQVASADGLNWFDLVQTDLEGEGYAAAAPDLCAASLGAPHIRQRLFWVADTNSQFMEAPIQHRAGGRIEFTNSSDVSWVADASRNRREGRLSGRESSQRETINRSVGCDSATCGMAHAKYQQRQEPAVTGCIGEFPGERIKDSEAPARCRSNCAASATNGFWSDADWLFCKDGKWRPVKPGVSPLVNGVAGRVGQLRAYGNAIVAPVAEAFIAAYLEAVK